MIVGVTGGRDYDDGDHVIERLEPYAEVGNVLVCGGADGADWLSLVEWVDRFQLPAVVDPAPWNRAGKPAGMMRNMRMAKGLTLAPYATLPLDVLVAFPGGRGTANMIRESRKLGVEIV